MHNTSEPSTMTSGISSLLMILLAGATHDASAAKTLFVGDSDIEGWETGGAFPNSANVGVGGYTCSDVLKRLGRQLDKHSPENVIIVCGENDLSNGRSPQATFADFSRVAEKVIAKGAKLLYMGTKPEPDTTELHRKYREYDALIRDYITELAAGARQPPLTMVDVYPSFQDLLGNPGSLYDNDGLHLSAEGYSYWTEWAMAAIEKGNEDCTRFLGGTCDDGNSVDSDDDDDDDDDDDSDEDASDDDEDGSEDEDSSATFIRRRGSGNKDSPASFRIRRRRLQLRGRRIRPLRSA